VTGVFGGNKSYSSSCSRSPFSLHRVGNEACSSIITYSFHPSQGLVWSWRPYDTLHSVLGIFPSAIVAEFFYPVLAVFLCFYFVFIDFLLFLLPSSFEIWSS
jgi:hypothetical protein